MLYFLLGIIAIGVLLASEGGKKIFSFLTYASFAVGLVYVGFWVVVGGIVFYNSDTLQSIFNREPLFRLAFWAIVIIYSFLGIMKLLHHFGLVKEPEKK